MLSESESKKIKYKTFLYERWLYERKDGGPDRRYSNNYKIRYYQSHSAKILDNDINISNKLVYNQIIDTVMFPINDVKFEGVPIGDKKITSFYKPIVSYTDRENIISLFRRKNITFNDYGDSFEFEYNNVLYLADKYGTIKENDITIKDLFEE